MVACVGPQPGEGFGRIDAGACGDHAFGLLDHDTAGQGSGELLVQLLGFNAGPVLQYADGGDVGERPGDDDVGLVRRGTSTLVMGRSLDGGEEQGARCDGTLASLEEAPDQNPPRRTSHRALIRLPGTPGLRLRRSRRPHSPVRSTRG